MSEWPAIRWIARAGSWSLESECFFAAGLASEVGEKQPGFSRRFQKFSRSDNSMVRGGVVPVLAPQLTVLLTGMPLLAVWV